MASDASPESELFREVARAPDRDHCPGAVPLISWREDDDDAFLRDVERRAVERGRLLRRGVDHGRWAALRPEGLVAPAPRRNVLDALRTLRWHAAQPVVLPGCVDPTELAFRGAVRAGHRLRKAVAYPGGLRAWLARATEDPGVLGERFAVGAVRAALADPERDVECVEIATPADGDLDLWIKAGRLSTHGDDRSLRLRFAFGEEGADDASGDALRHERALELATRLLPELRLVTADERLSRLLERSTGGPVRFTHPIAYWNAPGGGAALHHDAFDEPFATRQLGVAYAQLTGATLWLAASLEDLAARTIEMFEVLDEGALAWVRERAFPTAAAFEEARALTRERAALEAELALPDQGRLRGLIEGGPEFTALLLDAGHGVWMRPGDVLLLPNHGLARTALHSVFCAGDEVGYALSFGVRQRDADR